MPIFSDEKPGISLARIIVICLIVLGFVIYFLTKL